MYRCTIVFDVLIAVDIVSEGVVPNCSPGQSSARGGEGSARVEESSERTGATVRNKTGNSEVQEAQWEGGRRTKETSSC